MKKHLFVMLPLLASCVATTAFAATEADVENSFNPYKAGMPTFPGLTAGTVINKGNVDQFKDVLGAGVYKLVKDGLFEIKVAPTTQFTISKGYIDATKANLGKAKLGAKPGTISSFTFGRKSTVYSAPRYVSLWPRCRPKPRTSLTVMP